METKTEPTPEASKPAAKPNETKTKKSDTSPRVGIPAETSDGVLPPEAASPKPEAKNPLKDLDRILATAPKDWLPTMMVRIAKKCLAEKVFETPEAMAAAIVGASRK